MNFSKAFKAFLLMQTGNNFTKKVLFSSKQFYDWMISKGQAYAEVSNKHKGSFNNYLDRICHFLTPTPLRGQFLYPERGQKQNFFEPLPPPHLVHLVIEWPLITIASPSPWIFKPSYNPVLYHGGL